MSPDAAVSSNANVVYVKQTSGKYFYAEMFQSVMENITC
jgi:hypothetical protein